MLSQQIENPYISGWAYFNRCMLGAVGDYYMSVDLRLATDQQHNPSSEEVILDCVVKGNLRLLETLNLIYQTWRKKHRVLLQFTCQYRHFGYCYSGLTVEDPKNLLTLRAELISVGEWYCDGQRMTGASTVQ